MTSLSWQRSRVITFWVSCLLLADLWPWKRCWQHIRSKEQIGSEWLLVFIADLWPIMEADYTADEPNHFHQENIMKSYKIWRCYIYIIKSIFNLFCCRSWRLMVRTLRTSPCPKQWTSWEITHTFPSPLKPTSLVSKAGFLLYHKLKIVQNVLFFLIT